MKLSLLFCFLSLFLAISCGSDNDDDNDTPSVTTPTNEDDRQNEDDNDDVVSKYTSVVINANGFYEPSYNHRLRADLGRRPVIITGNFEQEFVEGAPAATCSFSVTLTEAQADRLERLANKLKICKNDKSGEEIVDFEENDLIYVTGRNGATTEAFKSYIGDFDMAFNWLCGGRSAFYSNMKALVRNKIPANCPAGALSEF